MARDLDVGVGRPSEAGVDVEVRGGSVATHDYPYFNLRLTSLEVEAEMRGELETRAVGGLVLEGPRAVTGVVRVFLAPEASVPKTEPPNPTRAGIL